VYRQKIFCRQVWDQDFFSGWAGDADASAGFKGSEDTNISLARLKFVSMNDL